MDAYFEEMLRRLKLTKTQKEDAVTKYTAVSKLLHAEFYDTQYDGSTKLIIGSYGKRTNIRPPEDVDLLFKIPEEVYARYQDSPSDLLQRIRKVFIDHYATTEEIHAWGKVVLVEFPDGKHNIELLPGFEVDGIFMIPNTEGDGSWDVFDVRTEMQSIADSNTATSGVTRKLIKMIKKWSKYTSSVTLKSYKIEEYCVSFLSSYDLTDMKWSQIVHDFFVWLATATDDDASQIKTAISRSAKAIVYEETDDDTSACNEWKKVFGKKVFPAASANFVKAVEMTILQPSPKEMYIHDIVPVRISGDYTVSVDSTFEGANYRPHDFAAFIRGRSTIAKHKSILFAATVTGPTGYRLMWKVRNFGDDAHRAGGLRGEITDGVGLTRREDTLYKGLHYVECYVIKDNVCVARTIVLVPIGDQV